MLNPDPSRIDTPNLKGAGIWSDRINATLLDIDQWFGINGDVIPITPREELERHLRRLSEQICGYAGFLGGAAPLAPAEAAILDEAKAKGFNISPELQAMMVTSSIRSPAVGAVSVQPFGYDAELAKRAMERRDAASAGKLVMWILWIILAIGLLVLVYGIRGARAEDPEHMAQYHTDPIRDAWFQSLKTNPDAPGARDCCKRSDCRRVEAEQDASGAWTIIFEGGRLPVPANRVITSPRSIDGDAYACLGEPENLEGNPVRCFIPPAPPT